METVIDKSLMFLASFKAINEDTGKKYRGFRTIRPEWNRDLGGYMPSELDMLTHFYTNKDRYGSDMGTLTIVKVKFRALPKCDNIMLNLN